ncbi:MAG TPA: LamG domain-containing protein [Pirellulales bacterium]|jgi:hypothetical protein|nr:LamG domain-containing protein [Pirellulales bacterium]
MVRLQFDWRWSWLILLGMFASTTRAATLDLRIAGSADDASTDASFNVNLTASPIDIVGQPYSGFRFTNVTIPKGATIVSATITYTAAATDSSSATVIIYGEDTDNAASYTAGTTGRNLTSSYITWSPIASWTAESTYSTPELKTLLQTIVNRSGWVSGNAVSLIMASGGTSSHRSAYSYDGTPSKAALLHVEYAVIPPPVATRLLMVVVNSASLTAQETLRKTAFASWGYTVSLISETASQATFDASAAANDVAYVCEDVTAANLSTKLKAKSLGIVNANTGSCSNLAIASTCSTTSATAVTLSTATHYITTPWPTGALTVSSASQSFATMSGTLATDLKPLGTVGGPNALAVIEMGGKLNDSTIAAGRRVQLPWGSSTFDFSKLNADGLTLLGRALAWAGGVVGYWKLDETSGSTASDASVNLLSGTLNHFTFDSSGIPSGKVGYALQFDGSSNYISRTNSTVLQLTKAISMAAWIKGGGWGSTTNVNAIIRKGEGGPNNYQLAIQNGYLAVGLDAVDGSLAHGNTHLQTGVWYHVVGTWDGTTVKLYVNGALDNSTTTHAAPLGTDTRALYIGGQLGGTGYFNGTLDDLRLFNYALEQDEITNLATQGVSLGVHILKWVEVQ